MNWLNLVHSTRLYYLTFQLQDTPTHTHTQRQPQNWQFKIKFVLSADQTMPSSMLPQLQPQPSSLLESSTDLVSCSYLACKCEAVPVVVPLSPPCEVSSVWLRFSQPAILHTNYFSLCFSLLPPCCRAEGLQNNLNVSLDCEICFSRCLIVAQQRDSWSS